MRSLADGAARDWLIRIATFAVLLTAWQQISQRLSAAVLPTPRRTLDGARELISTGELQRAWTETLLQVAAALALAAALGVTLGIVFGWFRLLDQLVSPVLTSLFLMPRIALVPLIALWFGLQDAAKIVLILAFSFFEIFFTVRNGVRSVEREYVEVAQSYCVPQRTMLRRVILPAAFPFVVTGLRLGLVYALVGVVLAGFFLEANGIGGLIYGLGSDFRTAELIAALFSVMLVGLALTVGLRRLEALVAPWRTAEAGR